MFLRRPGMGKKGYFFLFDAFLAMSAIGLGILMIYSFRSFTPNKVQQTVLADDVMESLSANKVSDLANLSGTGVYVNDLIRPANGTITNTGNTLLEQIGEFYATGKPWLAEGFAINVTRQIVPSQYGMELRINNSLNISISTGVYPKDQSEVLVSSKRIVSGTMNASSAVMWGPFVMEADVWL